MASPPASLPIPARARGFALPLAVLAGMVLLLAVLAAQTVLHQARLRNGAALAQRQAEDRLAAAAHDLVARLVPAHACLLRRPLEDWPPLGAACDGASSLEDLRQGVALAVPYRLVRWQPRGGSATGDSPGVDLELGIGAGAPLPPWQAAFALELAGDPPRVVALRELGLRGVLP